MSHRLKPKKFSLFHRGPRMNMQEAALRRMARLIRNQAQLEQIIAQTGTRTAPHLKAEMQRGCYERTAPLLRFKALPWEESMLAKWTAVSEDRLDTETRS